ncbi:MAG: NAD-dependent epimerase/dehydratase family protein [Gaiella sp.]
MRTLVTGGAGFIGTHLVNRLLDAGDEVVVLDSLEEQVHRGAPPTLSSEIEFVHADVGDRDAVTRSLRGVDRVAHLAAAVGVGQSMYEIARYTRTNTQATAEFLETLVNSSHKPERLVVASSMSIYGEGQYDCPEHGRSAPGPRPESQLAERSWEVRCDQCGAELEPRPTAEDKPLIPTSVYAVNKRDHEELCLVVGAAYGISAVALRFFNVYGPGQALSNPYTGVAAIFSSRLRNGNSPIVFEDGLQSRDFIHVDDIVTGIVKALEADGASGHAINLGTGRQVTILDIANALMTGLGLDIPFEFPNQYRAGDIRHCFADTSKAKRLLGFQASISLEDGMRNLISWVDAQESVDHVQAATAELRARGLAR